jgi:hypothetical protein
MYKWCTRGEAWWVRHLLNGLPATLVAPGRYLTRRRFQPDNGGPGLGPETLPPESHPGGPVKNVAVCSLCVALFFWLGAQPASAQFGPRGGLNLSDLVGSDVAEADARAGLAGGLGVRLLSLGPLSLNPELYYIQKGAGSAQLLAESPEMFDEFGLDYVEIPVLARLGFPLPFGEGRFRGYAEGGPAFAWRVNCSISASGGDASLNDECAFLEFGGPDAVIDSADRGAVLGGGLMMEVPAVGGEVSLDLRLTRGLRRLAGGDSDLDARNQSISLMLGFLLGH